MNDLTSSHGAPQSGAPTLHQRGLVLSVLALIFSALCVLAALSSAQLVQRALVSLAADAPAWYFIYAAVVGLVACLFLLSLRAFFLAQSGEKALKENDIVQARIDIASSRDKSFATFGWGFLALMALGFVNFVLMNDAAVGKTFFLLPLMSAKWWLVTKQFLMVNLFVFIIAEILVLVWGLVVALARLMPGEAGRPIRALAILYCDIFRGLPAVVTLYLIGFGIPTSGLSEMIVPHILGWFVDLSAMSPTELKSATRVPVAWWCILALTLTYGAYVAEVYRAGIESIHQSQIMASRSLGLSYMQTMRYVVIPQAVRRIVAPLLNDFIGLQKDTALVQVVGLVDSFNQAKIIASNAFNLSAVTVVAILFVVITIPQARLVDKMVERDNARLRAGG